MPDAITLSRRRMTGQARLYSVTDIFLLCCLLVLLAAQLAVEQTVQLTPALVLALGAVAAAACLKLRQVQEGVSIVLHTSRETQPGCHFVPSSCPNTLYFHPRVCCETQSRYWWLPTWASN